MEKLIFPMRTVSVTNGFVDGKHNSVDYNGADSGIDDVFAPCRCKILKVLTKSKTGYSNSVIIGSCDENGNPAKVQLGNLEERVITMKFTHDNFIDDLKVGRILQQKEVFYQEGTCGIATGNHIHVDLAYNNEDKWHDEIVNYKGLYVLPYVKDHKWILWLEKGYHTVRALNGYEFPWYEPTSVPTTDTIPSGKSTRYIGNNLVHLYKQSGKEKMTLIACENGQTLDFKSFKEYAESKYNIKVKALKNANYFVNTPSNPDYKKALGTRCNCFDLYEFPIGKGEQGFQPFNANGDKAYIDLVVRNNFDVKCADMNSWDGLPIDTLMYATSPALVLILNGEKRALYSPDAGYDLSANTQSFVALMDDNTFVLGGCGGSITPTKIRDDFMSLNAKMLTFDDNGGSTQFAHLENNEIVYDIYTGRYIPVCFMIYENLDDDEPVEPTPPVDDNAEEIEELKQQIDNLTTVNNNQSKMIEELTKVVDEQKEKLVKINVISGGE